ncbi:amidohydrolase [Flavobacterium sp. WLB]|uniref:amidohydrolase n=1 Tax=unclassified Flavobacterium TaxID=196869 RepID=UPI0006ABD113|nr:MULTISPECIES: amidohydrolase [unclassified Flavobacterium]KOP38361.1 amidohydrolase [Flavobacterium sp. VMW]OWU92140.1 amidohydrolase [Flavobacterium sp. NLM]PUU67807.1 amidohydrolase [Flavobacterium sp. WLB]
MKLSFKILAFLLLLSVSIFAQGKKATLIVHHAVIHTLDDKNTIAEAMAVADGKILKTGKNSEILKLKDKKTTVIDAKGKVIIPGIFDSHMHIIRGGRFFNTELRWDGVRSLKKALAMLKEQAQRTPKGQWVRVVGGWNAYQFEEKRLPTLAEINEATGDVPTFILHLYGHAYLNKAGLQALKIDANTPNPNAGLIEKDPEGNPTGLLVAEPNAFILYSTLSKLPELSPEEKINSTKQFMTEMNRLGVTAIMDAGGGFQNFPDDYGVTNGLCKDSDLTIRMPYYLFAQKAGSELNDYTKWINTVEIGEGCDDDHHSDKVEYHVQGAGENLVMSAGDFENFDKPRPELSPAMEGQLKEVLSLLIKNRWPFRIHATYNESITRFLNVIEDINKETPLNGLLWFFDHGETVSVENLKRIKALNGGLAIQHRMAYQGESFIKRYGKTAAANTVPLKKILELGIKVGMGTDGTRVASYNPWVGLYWLTTGKTLGGLKYMNDENILDRTTALKLFTYGSAQLINIEKDRGMLTADKLADFSILSDDYFATPEEKILNIESKLTVVNGKVVYADNEFRTFAKETPKAIPDWSPVNYFGGYQKN